jgi:hypothetical protein
MLWLASLILISKFILVKNSKCQVCVQSKQPRKPHMAAKVRNLAPLELVHSNLREMNGALTKGGKKYFMTLIDDSTRYCYVYLLKSKYEAFQFFSRSIKLMLKINLREKLNILDRIEVDSIFSNEFNLFCEEHGIIHERTLPYSPESNGVAEVKNRTLTEMVNAIFETSTLPWEWWGEAILITCYILNRVPMKNKENTPFEEWQNKRLTLTYLHILAA